MINSPYEKSVIVVPLKVIGFGKQLDFYIEIVGAH